MSLSNKLNSQNAQDITKKMEELTKNQIVATPRGFYKLSGINKDNNSPHYLSFSQINCQESEELKFEIITNYKMMYLQQIDSFSILDDSDSNSYNDDKYSPKLTVDVKGCSREAESIRGYFKEFIVNFAKLEQNEANEARSINKRHNCDFSILKDRNSLKRLLLD